MARLLGGRPIKQRDHDTPRSPGTGPSYYIWPCRAREAPDPEAATQGHGPAALLLNFLIP
jgi:hypothetical protein